ncbi:MAG: hypothetical protein Q8M83_02640 [bacterium]|nr:hypothetical protein [bacterium]
MRNKILGVMIVIITLVGIATITVVFPWLSCKMRGEESTLSTLVVFWTSFTGFGVALIIWILFQSHFYIERKAKNVHRIMLAIMGLCLAILLSVLVSAR